MNELELSRAIEAALVARQAGLRPQQQLCSRVEIARVAAEAGQVTLDGHRNQLLVRGDMAAPVLYGEVEIDPEGTLLYNSTDYEIER